MGYGISTIVSVRKFEINILLRSCAEQIFFRITILKIKV